MHKIFDIEALLKDKKVRRTPKPQQPVLTVNLEDIPEQDRTAEQKKAVQVTRAIRRLIEEEFGLQPEDPDYPKEKDLMHLIHAAALEFHTSVKEASGSDRSHPVLSNNEAQVMLRSFGALRGMNSVKHLSDSNIGLEQQIEFW